MVSSAVVAALAVQAFGDSKDDLSRAKNDYDSMKSRLDDEKSKTDKYLDESVKLRQMDKDQLNDLINQICRLDIERSDDEAERLAKDLADKVVDKVRRSYDQTVDDGSHVWDELGHLESDAKSLRDRVHDLENKDDVKSDAEHLHGDVDKLIESVDKLMEKVNRDKSTLDNVKEGVMKGANNPTIRARMDYGKEMHTKLQSSRSCDEKEVELSSGRPDCIKFDQDDCKVIEFKPDTYRESEAADQATRYLSDVRYRFKDDTRAKRCKQNSDGAIFTAVGELYRACRP
jgi:hypothetical protein